MAEVVFEVVAVLLEDVEGLVLDLPACACAVGEFGDVAAVDGQAGDEGAAGVEHGAADGLAGVQVVAEEDGPQCGAARAVALQPALDGLAFAVLLGGAVLGPDELRRQRQGARLAGCHQGGGEHLVVVLGAAVAALAGRAVRALQAALAEELGAVQGDQRPAVEAAHGRQRAVRVEVPDDGVELPVEVFRRHAVQELADVVVAGDAVQPEQGVRVGPPAPLGQRALVRKERRRLHEEHRQRRHADVRHGVLAVASPARVRHAGEARPQPAEMALEMLHRGARASAAMIAASTARRSAGGIAR